MKYHNEIQGKLENFWKKIKLILTLHNSLRYHKVLTSPQEVGIEVTNSCNLQCIMCDKWKWIKKDKRLGGNLTTQKLKSIFDEAAKIGVKSIILTGGEPTLRKDFCELIEYLSHLNFNIAITTNGTYITSKMRELLIKNNVKVFFSLHGSYAELCDKLEGKSGTFKKVIKNIRDFISTKKKYKDTRCKVAIRCVVQKENVSDLASLFKLADKLGVDMVTYTIVHGRSRARLNEKCIQLLYGSFIKIKKIISTTNIDVVFHPHLLLLLTGHLNVKDIKQGLPSLSLFRSKPVPCLASYISTFIDAFGNVYPCPYASLPTYSYYPHLHARRYFCLGNINEESLSEIWYGKKYDEFRREVDAIDINKFPFSIVCGHCENYYFFKRTYQYVKLLSFL